MCKRVGLTFEDLETMTIGMCVDYMEEFIEQQKPEKGKVRKATQSDFDSF